MPTPTGASYAQQAVQGGFYAIRLYRPSTRDGERVADLAVYASASFERTRHVVTEFSVDIPRVAANADLLAEIGHNWMVELWTEGSGATFLFGGYVTARRWSYQGGAAVLTIRGKSYLGWWGDRVLIGGTGSASFSANPAVGPYGLTYSQIINQMTYSPAPPYQTSLFNQETPDHPRNHAHFVYDQTLSDDEPESVTADTNLIVPGMISGLDAIRYVTDLSDKENATNPFPEEVPWHGLNRLTVDVVRGDDGRLVSYAKIVGWHNLKDMPAWSSEVVSYYESNRSIGRDYLYNSPFNQPGQPPMIFSSDDAGVKDMAVVLDEGGIENKVYVLAAGDGATRARYERVDAPSATTYGLIEGVLDVGQETDLNVINRKAVQYLQERSVPKIGATFTLQNRPGYIYGRDFYWDDFVSIMVPEIGLKFNAYVVSAKVTLGASTSNIAAVEVVAGSEQLAGGAARSLAAMLQRARKTLTYRIY